MSNCKRYRLSNREYKRIVRKLIEEIRRKSRHVASGREYRCAVYRDENSVLILCEHGINALYRCGRLHVWREGVEEPPHGYGDVLLNAVAASLVVEMKN